MTEPTVEATTETLRPVATGSSPRPFALAAFGVLSVAWVAYLVFGQVEARYWISGERQIEWKSIRRIWSVQLGELPGGTAVQWLFAGSMLVFVVGVIVGLYLLLLTPDAETADQDG